MQRREIPYNVQAKEVPRIKFPSITLKKASERVLRPEPIKEKTAWEKILKTIQSGYSAK